MSLNSFGLGFVFTARDLASATFKRVERHYRDLDDTVSGGQKNLDRAFGGLGKGLALATAGAGAVAAGYVLATKASTFDQSIAAVGAVAQTTERELITLRKAALSAGMATQYTPTDAAKGLQELAQAGFNARESIELLRPSLALAAGSLGELSPQQAAGLTSQALKAFGLESDDAAISVDRMLQAVNLFALGAGELPLALGTASRGAQTLKQSLSETLISLGLVKNIIPSVERSSTAVAVAMERLAKGEVQKKLRAMGVEVTNADKSFRNFLDILGDLGPQLDQMSDAERADFLIDAFGAEALGGINAILTQLTNGIPDATGQLLTGAAAVDFLRTRMEKAGGTAEDFADRLISTLAGQQTQITGAFETLLVQLGTPFAAVFEPIVTAILWAFRAVVTVLEMIPEPIQIALAALVVFMGTAVALTGAIVATTAAISLLTVAAAALEITLASVVAILAVVVAAMGLAAGAAAALYLAYRHNIGGLADYIDKTLGQVGLAFQALAQLFDEGVLSGAVLDELERTENEGVLAFVVKAWQFVARMDAVWEGLKAGVQEALAFFAPIFGALVRELDGLLTSFGIAGHGIGESVNGLPIDRFRQFGAIVGYVVGGILSVMGLMVVGVTRRVAQVADAFRFVWGIVFLIAEGIGAKLAWIGKGLGWVLTRASELGNWLGADDTKQAPVRDAGFTPDYVDPSGSMSVMPAAAELEAQANAMESALSSTSRSSAADQNINITTAVVMDSETVARATYQANQREASRAFSPLPAFG